ncbi:MAG: DNA gyrase subunit A, partial [Ruminiclostridium sp.]|nr:DNA gyrase subunit A [Ruminiclostridium sp.]
EGKERLMERFKEADLGQLLRRAMDEKYKDVAFEHEIGLSEEQADAIVQMRLAQLTGLEKEKIEEELSDIMEKIGGYVEILSDKAKVYEVIRTELDVIRKKYGDERRTSIEQVSGEVDIEDLIPVEECVLTYTNMGYLKRQPVEVYNLQRRGGKGVSGIKQRDEDFIENVFISSSHDNLLFVTNKGNMMKLKCFEVPEGSRQSRGTNVVNMIQLEENEKVAALIKTADFADNKVFICITKQGKIKRTPLSAFRNVRKKGLRAINLAEGDEIAAAYITEGDSRVLIATHDGRALLFHEDTVRTQGRSASGVRAIKLREGDYVVGATKIYSDDMTILTVTDKGYGRRTYLHKINQDGTVKKRVVADKETGEEVEIIDYNYPVKRKGGYGVTNYKVCEEKGHVCGIRALGSDDDVILISSDGVIIRIRANDIRPLNRPANGVRVMKLTEGNSVVSFTRTEHDENEKTEEVEKPAEEDMIDDADDVDDSDDTDETDDAEDEGQDDAADDSSDEE